MNMKWIIIIKYYIHIIIKNMNIKKCFKLYKKEIQLKNVNVVETDPVR